MSFATAYGITVRSNQLIPGLRPTSGPQTSDLDVVLGEPPPWRERVPPPANDSFEHHACGPGRYYLRYPDDTRFYLDLPTARIWATWAPDATLEDTATYLLGPVLGFYLRLRGLVCLHASAVLLDGRCVAFMGPAGSGKSTLAAAFAERGNPVVTEDVACLDEDGSTFLVRPGYPRIRLWQDSAELLRARASALPLLTPNWDKRYLALGEKGHRFHAAPAALGGVFLLKERRPMAAAAEAAALSGQELLKQLIANTYGKRLVDREMRAQEFDVLGRLAQSVPVRTLALNANGDRLPEACDWIERHAFA